MTGHDLGNFGSYHDHWQTWLWRRRSEASWSVDATLIGRLKGSRTKSPLNAVEGLKRDGSLPMRRFAPCLPPPPFTPDNMTTAVYASQDILNAEPEFPDPFCSRDREDGAPPRTVTIICGEHNDLECSFTFTLLAPLARRVPHVQSFGDSAQ